MNRDEIVSIIENYAPAELQEEWDNSGWQIRLPFEDIGKVLLCVTVTKDVVAQAIERGVNLIISHHPLFFSEIKVIDDDIVYELIKHDIQVYSAHTNFDRANEGTSGILARKLGFDNLEKIDDYIQIATLDEAWTIDNLVIKVKLELNLEKLQVISYKPDVMVKRVAFVAGSGGEFIEKLKTHNIDVFITSDIKYHNEVKNTNYVIFDVGHLESERPALDKFEELLKDRGFEIFRANEKSKKVYL